jgi:hypothetical protein
MVRTRRGRVAPVVGREYDQVAVLQLGHEFRQARVQFVQRIGVAGDVAAVAEVHVEVDEVDERERLVARFVGYFEQAVKERHIVRALDQACDALPRIDVADLAEGEDVAARILDVIQQRRRDRRHGVVACSRRWRP